jgi:hypothetical protein
MLNPTQSYVKPFFLLLSKLLAVTPLALVAIASSSSEALNQMNFHVFSRFRSDGEG